MSLRNWNIIKVVSTNENDFDIYVTPITTGQLNKFSKGSYAHKVSKHESNP